MHERKLEVDLLEQLSNFIFRGGRGLAGKALQKQLNNDCSDLNVTSGAAVAYSITTSLTRR